MYIVTETSKLCTVTGTITLAVVATNKKKRHQGQITFIWSSYKLSQNVSLACARHVLLPWKSSWR